MKFRNPNSTHPIHGTKGMDRVTGERDNVTGNAPLDLLAMRRKGQGGGGLDPFWQELLAAVRRLSIFNQQAFIFDTNVQRIRPFEDRGYLLIQNTDPAATLYVGFGITPSATAGIQLAPNGGYYEPINIPQNEIYVLGSAAGTGVIITASTRFDSSSYIPTELTYVE